MLAQEAKITIQSPYSSPFSLTCGLTTDRIICNDIMYKTETTPIFAFSILSKLEMLDVPAGTCRNLSPTAEQIFDFCS